IAQMKARIAATKARIAQLTKQSATNEAAVEQLDLAKAQLALDQDELDDAQQDLARQGGDRHANLERSLQEHEAAQHETAQFPKLATAAGTLSEHVQMWFSLRDRKSELLNARQQAANRASGLERQHDALLKRMNGAAS